MTSVISSPRGVARCLLSNTSAPPLRSGARQLRHVANERKYKLIQERARTLGGVSLVLLGNCLRAANYFREFHTSRYLSE
jgi:hypothetical protein